MGILYILKLSNGKYYIWSTKNLDQRLFDHQRGYVLSTKNRSPLLVFYKNFVDYKVARQWEYALKKYKKKSIIEKVVADEFVW
jgi:putative endonuclease